MPTAHTQSREAREEVREEVKKTRRPAIIINNKKSNLKIYYILEQYMPD